MSEPRNVICFDRVTKSFGTQTVLRQLNLNITQGEFVGLVGVNGAGKTTLIKSLFDLCDINSGTIKLFGTSHTQADSRERVMYLPERFAAPQHLTGNDFITYMLQIHGAHRNQKKLDNILDILQLNKQVLNKPVRTYSKGMTQKLGLAVCFISNKALFVLDEPMSGLDPQARLSFKRLLQNEKAQNHTVLLSTHALSDIEKICDRMVVLHDGIWKYDGTPKEFISRYDTADYDAAFMKCINS